MKRDANFCADFCDSTIPARLDDRGTCKPVELTSLRAFFVSSSSCEFSPDVAFPFF